MTFYRLPYSWNQIVRTTAHILQSTILIFVNVIKIAKSQSEPMLFLNSIFSLLNAHYFALVKNLLKFHELKIFIFVRVFRQDEKCYPEFDFKIIQSDTRRPRASLLCQSICMFVCLSASVCLSLSVYHTSGQRGLRSGRATTMIHWVPRTLYVFNSSSPVLLEYDRKLKVSNMH